MDAAKVSRKGLRLKGQRFERTIVKFLQAMGLRAERVPHSGSAGGAFGADVQIFLPGCENPARIEAKCRADGFRQDTKWLEGADALVKGSNLDDALIVFRLKDFTLPSAVPEEMRDAIRDARDHCKNGPTKYSTPLIIERLINLLECAYLR